MSYMKNLAIDRMNAEAEQTPDPECCPACYRRYWAMVESGEIDSVDSAPQGAASPHDDV